MAGEYYKISGDTMTQIADRTRVLSGRTIPMTPAEIIHYLSMVKFIPQGWAASDVELPAFVSASHAVGVLPEVQIGTAISTMTLLNLTSKAVGSCGTYAIVNNLTGWTEAETNPTTIEAVGTATLEYNVSGGDGTGATISVTGAEYVITQQDASFISITLSNPTENVTITITS